MSIFRPTTEIDLAGHNFVIEHWKPTKVMKNLPKIGRYVAVPMASIGGAMMNGGNGLHEALPTAILYLFDQMEQEDLDKLVNLILDGVIVDSVGKVDVDIIFQDKMLDLVKLLAKVLEINYGCFFSKDGFANLKDLLGGMGMAQQVDQLTPPPEAEAE